MATQDFRDHQYAFTAHIRSPEDQPIPEGIEERRMAIYTDLLYNNVEGFISGGFPVLRSIYDDADWHRMVRDFFANHQSRSPYFLEISQEFLSYLEHEREARPEDPAGMLELAHYEWVELALQVADEEIALEDIDPNGDLLDRIPVISPLAWSLAYQYPVHEMGPDNLPDAPPETPTYIVVYRNRQDQVRFLEINPVTARLIHLLDEDETLTGRAAIDSIITEIGHPDPDVVMQGGHAALRQLQEHGIILGSREAS